MAYTPRFQKPSAPATNDDVVRALEILHLEVSRLADQPPPTVNVETSTPTIDLGPLLRALENLKPGETPVVDVKPADVHVPPVDVAPLIEAVSALGPELGETLKEALGQIAPRDRGGSHFDGRMRTRDGKLVSASNPSPTSDGALPDLTGTWDYSAGTSGTEALSGSKRVLSISAIGGTGGGTVAINGGDAIPVPESMSLTLNPEVQLVDPTVVFTGTDSYVIDWLED